MLVPEEGTSQEARAITLLKNAPLGSRMLWRNHNIHIKSTDAFKRENAILIKKIGSPDKYIFASHPYGFVTAAELKWKLRKSGERRTGVLAAPEEIFLQQVEIFMDSELQIPEQKFKKPRIIGGEGFNTDPF